MRRVLFLCLLAGAWLSGSADAEPTRTVAWYRQHTTERQGVLKECRNNPGELGGTPNCINAEKADAMDEAAKTGSLHLKPLTEKDWGPTPWRLDSPHRSK